MMRSIGLHTYELDDAEVAVAEIKAGLESFPLMEHSVGVIMCDPEYIEELAGPLAKGYDAVLSMACSIGPQFVSRRYPAQAVYPALNTCFMGGALSHGIWAEHCQACGDCVIHKFGGFCPISRCSKSLLNGPCGGSASGKCEVSKEIDCVWHLIVDKMKADGRLEELLDLALIKNWRTSRDGGPRKIVREELLK
jgi:hypothetical protein